MEKVTVQISFYGNTKMDKVSCPQCDEMVFLIDGVTSCCDVPVIVDGVSDVEFASQPEQARKRMAIREKEKILQNQENKCIYCGITFGGAYERKGKIYFTYPVWDHFVPYAFSQNSKCSNYVAACRICNSIKSSKMFPTIEKAKTHIRKQRVRKGIRII